MNISPFLTVSQACEQTLPWVNQQLLGAGLRSVQTLDLHAARASMRDCECRHHGTDQCDCQLVVLLVYGKMEEPSPLILHGNVRTTCSSGWLSQASCLHGERSPLPDRLPNGGSTWMKIVTSSRFTKIQLLPSIFRKQAKPHESFGAWDVQTVSPGFGIVCWRWMVSMTWMCTLNMEVAEISHDSQKVTPTEFAGAIAKAGNDGHHEYRARLVAMERIQSIQLSGSIRKNAYQEMRVLAL
jgi:hypothetical protein